MINQVKFFPNQGKGEKVFLLIRKHWFNYTIFFFLDLLAALPIIGFIYYWINNPEFIQSEIGLITFLILSIFLLLLLAAQLYGFVDYYLDVYIVTDQRIVDISQDGFFKRQISELHLHQVQDVNANVESFWGTLLHFGDVRVQTAGEREIFIFKSIPHPYTVAKQIISLHEKHMEQGAKIKKKEQVQLQSISDDRGLPYEEMQLPQETKKEIVAKTTTQVSPPKPIVKRELVNNLPNSNITQNNQIEEGELTEGEEMDL